MWMTLIYIQVNAVTETEQLDGVSLDAVSPIPPSPSTSTGLSSQTEVSSQVEADVTRNPSQANPLPVSQLDMHTANDNHCGLFNKDLVMLILWLLLISVYFMCTCIIFL